MQQSERQRPNPSFAMRFWSIRIGAVAIVVSAATLYLQPFKQASHSAARVIQGKIVNVADGDTATLLTPDNTSIRIRFAFIDAPEKQQPYGQAAKKNLATLINNQMVKVYIQDIDRYGRTVGQVCLGKRDINLSQLQAGYAWHYQVYAKKTQSKEAFARYNHIQAEAKRKRLGLWRDSHPIPPWEFRKTTKVIS